jgi:dipeptidyl aminopeptidase/acylaminoacyl peptidase
MSRRNRRLFHVGLTAIMLPFLVGAGAIFTVGLYDRLTKVEADCGGGYRGQTPAWFAAPADSGPYLMPDFQEVRFPSRDRVISVDAWWVPGPSPDSPAVVLAHGLRECKRATTVLFPAGMLRAHGFAVLMIDLRNEGSSTVDTGRFSGGVGEAQDVLGAWDWLREMRGIPAERIGLFGVSLGAGAVLIAAGEEPRVAAVWEDSGYAELIEVTRHQLWSRGIPPFFADLAMAYGRLQGRETTSPSPGLEVSRFGNRPLAIVHGEQDRSVPVGQAYRLMAIDVAAGGRPVVWILPDTGHTGAMGSHPADYESRLVGFFSAALGGGSP